MTQNGHLLRQKSLSNVSLTCGFFLEANRFGLKIRRLLYFQTSPNFCRSQKVEDLNGNMHAITIYAISRGKNALNIAIRTAISLMMLWSKLKYSAIPPHTPQKIFPCSILYNFFGTALPTFHCRLSRTSTRTSPIPVSILKLYFPPSVFTGALPFIFT